MVDISATKPKLKSLLILVRHGERADMVPNNT
jgi:hypothetical protein